MSESLHFTGKNAVTAVTPVTANIQAAFPVTAVLAARLPWLRHAPFRPDGVTAVTVAQKSWLRWKAAWMLAVTDVTAVTPKNKIN